MAAPENYVLLDLNYPAFQQELLKLDANEVKKIFKTLRKIKSMAWHQVYSDNGLNWEAIKGEAGKFTVRVSLQYRAVTTRDGDWMRFYAFSTDHDSAYP